MTGVVENSTHCFDTRQNFMDPQLTDDGRPYAPIRYSQLIQECYVISKQTNTPYTDVRDNMTPRERREILKLIYDEFKQSQERMKEIRNK